MIDQSIREYLDELGKKEGLPGGGSAAGIVGAMSTALAQMVVSIQMNKKKYQEKKETLQQIADKAEELRRVFEELTEKDAKAFEPVSKAYALPKETEEQKAERLKQIDEALKTAAQPPLNMMKHTVEVLELFESFIALDVKGTIVNDIAVGVLFAKTTLEVAYLNVRVNTKMLKDKQFKQSLEERSQLILDQGLPKADEYYEATRYYLANNQWPNE